jgi:NAD(P)-dependent dehydrogenase (short-subunit alcohol dehydrogenase family)
MDVEGKVALVTGASTGIGLATAVLLAGNGAKLALNARSEDKLEELSGELPGSAVFPADMSDESAVRTMVADVLEHFGRLDILINNAGRGLYGPLESIDTEDYRRLLELNLVGPLVAMQAAIPVMREQGAGTIVNISSGTALMYAPGLSGYSATKRALGALSLTARSELAGENITVSLVYPYVTKSDFYKNLVSDGPRFGAADEYVAAGRAPADTCEHVAGLILEAIRTGEPEVFAHDWMKNAMK